jgi:hypothetical protein
MSKRISIALIPAVIGLTWASATQATAATLRVCPQGCGFRQIAPAVDAAGSGDLVEVAAGTYEGGFTIDKDLTLDGAGAGQTTISGGGPVVTVGTFHAAQEPAVVIRGVRITGGVTRSSFGVPYQAVGGGVWVPPSAEDAPGATLRITRSVITGNRAAPASSVDSGLSCGTAGDCPFAQAGGGGLDSWGRVTVDHSVVSDNQAAGPSTSDADGGGIYAQEGTLSVTDSTVRGNEVIGTVGSGRFAEGAGIMFDTFFTPGAPCVSSAPACTLVIRNTVVERNSSRLTSAFPIQAQDGSVIAMSANAGGIHIGDGISATIVGAWIAGNVTSATDPNGEPFAIDSGMIVGDSRLVLRDSQVDGNLVATTSATEADQGPVGSALEADGPTSIIDSSISGNVATSTSPNGDASVSNGLLTIGTDPVTVQDSTITGNFSAAHSDSGSATVLGGAVFNNSLLRMRDVAIERNVATAQGPTGVAQGGGIWNGVDLAGPPVELTLTDSSVTHNILDTSSAITPQGGGIYTTLPVTLNDTVVTHNEPDQCAGCASGPIARAVAPSHRRGALRRPLPESLRQAIGRS